MCQLNAILKSILHSFLHVNKQKEILDNTGCARQTDIYIESTRDGPFLVTNSAKRLSAFSGWLFLNYLRACFGRKWPSALNWQLAPLFHTIIRLFRMLLGIDKNIVRRSFFFNAPLYLCGSVSVCQDAWDKKVNVNWALRYCFF